MSQKYQKIQRFVPNTKCPKYLLSEKPKVPTTFSPNILTVPVEATYQVWRVTRVLSMGKVGSHVWTIWTFLA